MESLLVLLLVYLAFALIFVPIWTFIKFGHQKRENENLHAQLAELTDEIRRLRESSPPPDRPPAPARATPAVAPMPVPEIPRPVPAPAAVVPPGEAPRPATAMASRPDITAAVPSTPAAVPTPPALPPPLTPRPVYQPPPEPARRVNWEQFMGAKLFAWLGGLALFLGIAFFVKYSFEHDLIPPEVRVAIGFVVGAALIIGGLRLSRERYEITVQTLIAAGVVSLYAVTFACNSIYHFAFFGTIPTFLLMVLITATAFILAVRLEAQVIAILGLLGGFLTPWLLSTGHDNPPGLFGYLALLDVGLAAVALHRRWPHLVALAAGGTVAMMIGWADRFFTAEKSTTAMVVGVGFVVLFSLVNAVARRLDRTSPFLSGAAAAMAAVAFGFAAFFLGYPAIGARPIPFFTYLLVLDLLVLALVWGDERVTRLHWIAGFVVFALLAAWTHAYLQADALRWALVAYLVFGAVHAIYPPLLERRRPETAAVFWSQVFPPLTLLLMLVPLVRLETVSVLFWPAVLLVDLLAIGIAAVTASLAIVGAMLVLTLVVTGVFLFQLDAGATFEPSLLLVIGGFAVFFVAASAWLGRRLGAGLAEVNPGLARVVGDARSQLPAFSSVLPFALLMMACGRLAVPDPSTVFGLGLLLVILTLGLARIMAIAWLPACALAGMAAVEYVWHHRHFDPTQAATPRFWYLLFFAVFAVFPFLFRRRFLPLTGPWAVAALSGVAQFPLIYWALKPAWPEGVLGAIPALAALVPLASLLVILRSPADQPAARLNQLAWFGGATLFFITLVFPIQFERQWLTVAWALEGCALLWLFHRVPHPGLRATGVVLLVVAFARLALNPAVLSYHVRGETPLLNWFLYAYGLATIALFLGARLLAPPRERVFGLAAPPLLNTLAVILAFVLLNLEIADYFTEVGASTVTFQFSGNFARDMSYTIGWALFALALLVAGIWTARRAARYAALALLSVALLKLFFHDLARLAQLYRIGALIGVAVIAMLASLAYQRFLPNDEKHP